jgi:catechol 2,3-dioxygenase-like lactoylglutathione lyase family enzyme
MPTTDVLGAVGIGVADLIASTTFYIDVLGMQQLRTYHVGDLDEIVIGFPKGDGPVVVLMHWQNDATRKYDGTNVKLVFDVDDPAAVLVRILAHGGKVELEATPAAVLNGRVIGLGRDPDNYLIELLKR